MIISEIGNWPSYHKEDRPVWFWVIENVNSELSGLGLDKRQKSEIIQRLKNEGLKSLNMRGNMLNLREKHIPRIKEIYVSVLENGII